jgi:hypothetical protein
MADVINGRSYKWQMLLKLEYILVRFTEYLQTVDLKDIKGVC